MNLDRVVGRWKQLKGMTRQKWGRLTRNYAGVVIGKREQLLGETQAAYGVVRQAKEKQLAEWLARQHKIDPLHK
jgi:uncharacterized protein YjbJ (UPF0337 family)